jgi:hypothetical protein
MPENDAERANELQDQLAERDATVQILRDRVAKLENSPYGRAVAVCEQLLHSKQTLESFTRSVPIDYLNLLDAVANHLHAIEHVLREYEDAAVKPNPIIDELVGLRDVADRGHELLTHVVEETITGAQATDDLCELIKRYNVAVDRCPREARPRSLEPKMTKQDPPASTEPTRLSEPHAVEQYLDRWASTPKSSFLDLPEYSRAYRAARRMLEEAIFVARHVPGSWQPKDLDGLGQGIWTIQIVALGNVRTVRIVVDGNGLVRTVLPPQEPGAPEK